MKPIFLLSLVCALSLLAACSGPEMVPPPPELTFTSTPTAGGSTASSAPQEATPEMTPTSAPQSPAQDGTGQPPSAGRAPQPFDPQPGDQNLHRGPAYIKETQIVTMESYPPQFAVSLAGNLPTPCNRLRVKVTGPDTGGRIDLEVYSVSSPDAICAQVLVPFQASVPLGVLPKGAYTAWVNGAQVGEFQAP